MSKRFALALGGLALSWLSGSALAGEPVSQPRMLPGQPVVLAEQAQPAPAATAVVTGDASCATCDSGCGSGGVFGNVDWIYWKARTNALDFALTALDTVTPAGKLESLQYDRESGVRLGLGYRTANAWEVGFVYTYFHTNDGSIEFAPELGAVFTTRLQPSILVGIADFGAATASLDMDVYDLEIGHRFNPCDSVTIRVYGGPRAATIDQDFDVFYFGMTAGNGVGIDAPINMDAYGIRAGFDAGWNCGGGLTLFGRLAGSVLVGEFHSRLTQQFVGEELPNLDINSKTRQMVPVLETALGASWSKGGFTVAGGYEMSNWFNMVDRLRVNSDPTLGALSYSVDSSDLGFDGFFVTVGFSR